MWAKRVRKHVGGLVHMWLHDPIAREYRRQWSQSLKRSHNALDDEWPWVTFGAFRWLEQHLRADMSVFEYGSGGSTVYFAKHVRRVVSVEHNGDWYERVSQRLAECGATHCEYRLIRPEPIEYPPGYTSDASAYRGLSFFNYVKAIDEYADDRFDLIVVDGRSRCACVRHAIARVKAGGYLILDNSDRSRYDAAHAAMGGYAVRHFYGLGPYRPTPWQTTVWQLTARQDDTASHVAATQEEAQKCASAGT